MAFQWSESTVRGKLRVIDSRFRLTQAPRDGGALPAQGARRDGSHLCAGCLVVRANVFSMGAHRARLHPIGQRRRVIKGITNHFLFDCLDVCSALAAIGIGTSFICA